MPGARRAKAAPRAALELGTAAQREGMCSLPGSSPDVGVVGFTLGGGLSWLGRRYGFACNRVNAIELVSADGEVRRVDADNDADLFWALRGGGGGYRDEGAGTRGLRMARAQLTCCLAVDSPHRVRFLSYALGGGPGRDAIKGGRGDDLINGGDGRDTIEGDPGDDEIKGIRKDDFIDGGRGRDRLHGDRGNDRIRDLRNRNRISCGKGFDRVVTNEESEVARNCEKVTRR